MATARRCYREAMKVRPREATDRSAAMAFLARHNHARVARLGKLLEPLDYPALLAEAACFAGLA